MFTRKEVKTSKAEDKAYEAYPIVMSQYSDNCKEYDSNESDRLTFIEGYRQAEKDLEPTLEDMEKVFDLCYEVLRDVYLMKFPNDKEEQKEFYQEVLKQFKNLKK